MAVNPKKVKHKINLSKLSKFRKLDKDGKAEVKERVGNFVKESILTKVGGGGSPVSNAPYQRSLSPEYKKAKSKISSSTFANLELHGDMLSKLEFNEYLRGVEIGIFDESEIPKAYNHNVGDTLPTRRFIPLKGEKFLGRIETGIKQIVKRIHSERKQ